MPSAVLKIKKTIANDVYTRLRNQIISCTLRPGAKINIQSLCVEMGVSLGAVREALSKLSAEGLVNAFEQRGYAAAEVSIDDLRELTAARIKIEQECICSAIDHRTLDWETGIVAALHRLSNTPYILEGSTLLDPAWAKAHHAFHGALVAACDNRWLLRIRSQLYDQSERYRQVSVPVARVERDVKSEHDAIAAAVLKHDKDEVCRLIAAHLEKTATIVIEALKDMT